jgi:hypothetical protein
VLPAVADTTNNYTSPGGGGAGGGTGNGGVGNSRFTQAMNETCIDARHVVHIGLNEGLDFFLAIWTKYPRKHIQSLQTKRIAGRFSADLPCSTCSRAQNL